MQERTGCKLFCLDLVLRLLCFVKAKTLCRYGSFYFLPALAFVCVDMMVMSSAVGHDQHGYLGSDKSAV